MKSALQKWTIIASISADNVKSISTPGATIVDNLKSHLDDEVANLIYMPTVMEYPPYTPALNLS
jgi:hypothetical protein